MVPTYARQEADFALTITEDVGLADGMLRRLEITGTATFDVKAKGRSGHAEVSFSTLETTTRLAAGAEFQRPADAWKPFAVLAPSLDARPWRIAHHRMAADSGAEITEWLVDGERVIEGSEGGWTEMVTTHRYPESPGNAKPEDFAERLRLSIAGAVPTAVWTALTPAAGEVSYEWTFAGDRNHPAQHEIGRVLMHGRVLLHIAYVKKVARIPLADRNAWIARLAKAAVTGDR
jgi:hypothetical protein